MAFYIIPDEEALSQCAWCRKYISAEEEVFSAGVKCKPGVDLSEYEGHCIDLNLVSEEKPVYMLVTIEGSDAKQDGNDGMLLFCSKNCGNELKRVLDKEISIGGIFEAVKIK